MPQVATKSNKGKNLKVLLLTHPTQGEVMSMKRFDPSYPQGPVMSVKCEQPLNELTVQVWLLYVYQNLKYCTLYVRRTELWTNRHRQMIQTIDAPGGPLGTQERGYTVYFDQC